MELSNVIKLSVIAVTAALFSACGSNAVDYASITTSNEKPAVIKALEWDDESLGDYSKYKASTGHKAFAVVISQGIIQSTGASVDKISINSAEEEALRICQYHYMDNGQCFILDRDSSNINIKLSKSEINAAPKELTSFSDIENYFEFVNAVSPKAFAISPITGKSFWARGGFSLKKVQEVALQSCNEQRDILEPHCELLVSQ